MSSEPQTKPAEAVRNGTSPGRQMMARWDAQREVCSLLHEQCLEAENEAARLYREMVRLGRKEGWHI